MSKVSYAVGDELYRLNDSSSVLGVTGCSAVSLLDASSRSIQSKSSHQRAPGCRKGAPPTSSEAASPGG